jgi:hypothetical protein
MGGKDNYPFFLFQQYTSKSSGPLFIVMCRTFTQKHYKTTDIKQFTNKIFTVFLCPLMHLLFGYSENNTKKKKQIKE